MANDESRGWVSSMKSLLGSLTLKGIKACSISGVPPQFRKSEKEAEAYKPKVVSIGPLYRGTKTELLHMEEIKYRCMLSLFHRTRHPLQLFTECSEAILHLDMVFRAFYVDDIKFNSHDLAKIMLLDGCFLLELLISNAKQSNIEIPLHIESHSSDPEHAAADVRKMREVISDLKLLGNQIPLHVLILLFKLLFLNTSELWKADESVQDTIYRLALFFFGYSPPPRAVFRQNTGYAHLLDLLHDFVTESVHKADDVVKESKADEIVKESNYHSVTLETSNSETKPELKFCAYRLLSDGIEISKITPAEEQSKNMEQRNDNPERVIFDCCKSLRFNEGILEIQPLTITKEMEIQWRNFIAWEQNRIIHEKYIGKKSDQTNCKFSEFALLLKGLVCCEHDIKQLKKKGVIVADEKRWSNEDLMNLFRRIAGGIQDDTSQLYYKMIQTLRPNSGAGRNFSLFWLWHKFRRVLINTRYSLREMFATLKRDHTTTVWKTIGVIAAVVLLFLTIAQTVFAAIGL